MLISVSHYDGIVSKQGIKNMCKLESKANK